MIPGASSPVTSPDVITAARSWLDQQGLPQYRAAFEASGYDDWPQLQALDDDDLDAISRHGHITLLPGHKKKLLLASKQLAGEQVRRHHLCKGGSWDRAKKRELCLTS